MPKIENVAAIDIQNGNHVNYGENCILIQIADSYVNDITTGNFHKPFIPEPIKGFRATHLFQFLDIEEDSALHEEYGIQNDDAKNIVKILQHAIDMNYNVVVHCFAGICRSGAVVEVAEMMGFEKCNNFRLPNTLVKKKLMKVLGWTYD